MATQPVSSTIINAHRYLGVRAVYGADPVVVLALGLRGGRAHRGDVLQLRNRLLRGVTPQPQPQHPQPRDASATSAPAANTALLGPYKNTGLTHGA